MATAGASRIVRFPRDAVELSVAALPTEVEDATAPVVSADASRLGFIRQRGGRGQLWLLDRSSGVQRPIASPDWDVLDFAFFPDNRIVLAARQGGRPGLFVVDAGALAAAPVPLAVSDRPARYPAVSPDGRWLAYAEREHGNWQLWVLPLAGGERRRLTGADCNTISPAWRADSKTLIYASDCGRGFALTALGALSAIP